MNASTEKFATRYGTLVFQILHSTRFRDPLFPVNFLFIRPVIFLNFSVFNTDYN